MLLLMLTELPIAVRNPWDVVVSAYWYHLQQPAPETWIDKPVRTC